ncbi:MAG: hypothetical protein EHM36_01800, partial [Deltaproteobacteria bacterium]
MMNLPRSYYYRLTYQSSRSAPLKADYPLVFFSFFSRLALGMGILGGTGQLLGISPPISSLILQIALGLGLLCMVIAQLHATDKRSLFHVFANWKSLLTWEISSLLLFLVVLTINALRGRLAIAAPLPSTAFAVFIILSASFTLVLTALIYGFYSHPVWNTHWVSMVTFTSALTLG